MPDKAAVMADWVPSALDPPPGSVGNDRDGAHFFMGVAQWTPDREGQAPAVVPPPRTASRQDPEACTVCGADVPPGMTCGGCLAAPSLDGRLTSEVVRDHARDLERQAREEAEKGPQDFAARMYRKVTHEARESQPPAPAGPAEPRPQPGRKRKVKR